MQAVTSWSSARCPGQPGSPGWAGPVADVENAAALPPAACRLKCRAAAVSSGPRLPLPLLLAGPWGWAAGGGERASAAAPGWAAACASAPVAGPEAGGGAGGQLQGCSADGCSGCHPSARLLPAWESQSDMRGGGGRGGRSGEGGQNAAMPLAKTGATAGRAVRADTPPHGTFGNSRRFG